VPEWIMAHRMLMAQFTFLFMQFTTISFWSDKNAIQNNFDCGSFRTRFDSSNSVTDKFFFLLNSITFRGVDQGI
jgi:hypothetical protein